METYIYQGQEFTKDYLENYALQNNLSLDELLEKNPDIEIKGDFQTGVAGTAVTAAPENVTADGGSSSVADLLVSKPVRERLEEQEDARQAQINAIVDATNIGSGAKIPGFVRKGAAQFLGGASELIRNAVEYIDAGVQVGGPIPSPASVASAQAQKIIRSNIAPLKEDQGIIDTSEWKKYNNIFTNISRKYYNDDGSQANTGDLFKQGRIGEMSDKIVNEAFTALPSLLVAFTGIGGVTTLGASAAGGAFERTMQENPDTSLHKAFFISNLQGGIEAVSERIGVKILKGARTLAGAGTNKQLVQEATKKLGTKFLQRSFGEGVTEGAAAGFNETIQAVAYDGNITEEEFRNIGRAMVDEFAVGTVLGGGASTITINSSDPTNQNIAMHIAPNSVKNNLAKQEFKKLELIAQKNIVNTKRGKNSIDKKIQAIDNEINTTKTNIVESFNNLTKKEKIAYAETIDNINSGYDILYNKSFTKTPEQKKELSKQIKNEYKNLENIIGYKQLGTDLKTEQVISETLKASENIVSKIRKSKFKDLDVEILETPAQIEKAEQQYPNFKSSDGIFVSPSTKTEQSKILINLPVASATQQTNVLGHEKLHYLLSKYFKTDNTSISPLVESFKSYLVESGNGNILTRIDERLKQNGYIDKDGNFSEGALEEYFSMFSDIVANEKINVVEEKGIANKLASAYTNTMQGLGFAEVKLTNGKEVFDFIRNYTKHIQKSDKILGVRLVGDGQIQKVTPEDVVIKKSKSKEIDNAYESGATPFDITLLYEPLVNKLINKYKNVPDFNVLKEDLVQNALYEKGGVIDLINSYDGRGTLSGYVAKLLPLRMNKMASDLFGQQFTDDVTERVDVAAQETLPEQVEREETQAEEIKIAKTQETRNVLDRANLSNELQVKAFNASKKVLSTMLPQIDVQKGRNFREKYKIAVRNMLYEDVATELRSFNNNDFFGYIESNAENLYNLLPLQDLTKSQALKDLFLEQQFDKNGKPVRVLESFTGKKSYAGNLVFKKKPFNKVKNDFLNEFAKKHSNTAQRKAFIINTLAKEIAFDQSMDALNDPAVQEKLPLTQQTAINEFNEEFERNIERGRFTKYSKTLDSWVKENPLVNDTKLLLGIKDMKLGQDPAAQFKRVYTGIIPDETLDQIVFEISQLPKPRYIKHSITKSKAEGLADEVRFNFNTELPFKTSGITKYTDEQVAKFVNQSRALVDGDYVDLAYLKSPGHKDKAHDLMLGGLNAVEYNDFYDLTDVEPQSDSRLAVATDPKARKNATSPKTRITKDNQTKANLENQKALEKQKSIINHYIGLSNAMVDGIIDKEYIAATIFHDTSGRSRNTLRRASYFLGWVPEVMETRNANYEMEHAKPFTENAIELVNAVSLVSPSKSKSENQKIIQNAFDKFFSQNAIIAIPYSLQTEYLSKDATVAGGFPFSRYSDNLLSQIEFVDDTGNINMDLFDINYKEKLAQQADALTNDNITKFSKSASAQFADMLDRKSKKAAVIRSDKDVALAANLGKKANYKNKWNIFLPYSAEDFYGLLQKTAGKGQQGDADIKFIKEKLLDPYDRGIANLEIDRRALLKSYRNLKKQIKASPEKLDKKLSEIGLDAFSVEDAVRVFIWNQQNMSIPSISKTNSDKLSNYVAKNNDLRKFAFGLMKATKSDKYPEPDTNWFAGKIGTDLSNSINKNKRSKYLEAWNKNVKLILNDKNKTKLTAAFGTDYVKNLEDTIQRMKSGVNRVNNKFSNATLDFINGSIGTIMFFNMRSASLQLISAANYLNWTDNNPLQAGKALANVPQYTKDLLKLLNSDFLVNRRNGLKINVQEAELADAVKSENKFKAIMAAILKAGFIPTQFADSLAIAGGGATFYRNRINTYLKEGLSEKNAEAKAYNDWRSIANDSQQSSDASRISNIQASDFGRLIFAFANTPFQYTRLTKKALSDLVNKRGDTKTNLSKIVYYMTVQNLIFNALQNALFVAEAEEDETKLQAMLKSDKIYDVLNNMSNSILRGLGLGGAVIAMLKDTGFAFKDEMEKEAWRRDSANVLLKVSDISPPIDHKLRKVKALAEIGKYDNDIPPSLEAAINVASILNIPLDRLQRKIENLKGASDRDLDNWMRIFHLFGWSDWELKDASKKESTKLNIN